MGAVIPIVSQEAAERAWEDYRAHMLEARSNPNLLVDREWMQQRRRLERRWERLFDRMDEL
jgi:hypothetical protein